MKVKLKNIEPAANSNQKVVEIDTTVGSAFLMVDTSQIVDNHLEVGGPVGIEPNRFLIELPQETFNGDWRVWISKSQLQGA